MPSYRNVIFQKFFFLHLGTKYNFLNLIGHLQGLPNHILAYHLFYFSLKYVYMEFKLPDSGKKRHFFNPYLTPVMKIKNQKPYCTSTKHTQSYPRVSFVYYLTFKWSSSDKPCMTEDIIVRPSCDPKGKCLFRILTAHLQD